MANPYMSGARSNGYMAGAGRKASSTNNASGKASSPRGGRVRIGASKGGTMSVYSGSSGKALRIGGKQK